MVILLIIIVILIIVSYLIIRRLVQTQVVFTPTGQLEVNQAFNIPLVTFTYDITNNSKFAIFKNNGTYYLLSSTLLPITDVYPSFNGDPFGLVVNSGRIFIFSTNGLVYNPVNVADIWRRLWPHLPNDTPLSVDGYHLDIPLNFTSEGIGFTFYYTDGYYRDLQCSDSTCDTVLFMQGWSPPSGTVSVTRNGTVALLHDGRVMQLITPYGWAEVDHWDSWYSNLVFPPLQPPLSDDNQGFVLLGADHEDGKPYFLISEFGQPYIVDSRAHKYPLYSLFDKKFRIEGNVIDFTKFSNKEVDFLLASDNGYLYGPSLQSYKLPLSTFETLFWTSKPSNINLIGVTHINKSFISSQDPTITTQPYYYLVFLYDSGEWFEVQYDYTSGYVNLGETSKTQPLWTQWPHLVQPLSKGVQVLAVSSDDWSFYMNDGFVYSMSNPPESWRDILTCSLDVDSGKTKTSKCAGMGGWSTVDPSWWVTQKDGTVVYSPPQKQDKLHSYYSSLGNRAAPSQVINKVGFNACISGLDNDSTINGAVYDSSESNCSLYSSIAEDQSYHSKDTTTVIKNEFVPSFENKFCIKHLKSGKYLYYDFNDPKHTFLGLSPYCIYNLPDPSNPSSQDVSYLRNSLGALWTFNRDPNELNGAPQYLSNANPSLSGYLGTSLNFDTHPTSKWSYSNNDLHLGSQCLNFNTSANLGPCNGSFQITPIPCPSDLNFCTSQYNSCTLNDGSICITNSTCDPNPCVCIHTDGTPCSNDNLCTSASPCTCKNLDGTPCKTPCDNQTPCCQSRCAECSSPLFAQFCDRDI